MKTDSEVIEPKKVGRPPKEKKGEMVWVPADQLDFIKSYLETVKKREIAAETDAKK